MSPSPLCLRRLRTSLCLKRVFSTLITAATVLLVLVVPLRGAELVRLDHDWKFQLGEAPKAFDANFDDQGWRSVNLPHDWSIEHPTSRDAATEGAGGFFLTGDGWYRRQFKVPPSWEGNSVSLVFEGVSTRAKIWVNGKELGEHHYAYTPFEYDLTPLLRQGESATIAVYVDNRAQPNSRWYAGSGLYRHVWLRITHPLHLAPDSVFVRAQVASDAEARVVANASLENRSPRDAAVAIEATLVKPDGSVAAVQRQSHNVNAGSNVALSFDWTVVRPLLWSPESPHLYRARFKVLEGRKARDVTETFFGIRTVSVSAERGFQLNGKTIKLVGGNVHHDNGPLGAASFDRAEERKAELLKAAGFNAVRTSHNPPSRAFLDACDRLGLLVMDEAFDGWAKPKTKHGFSDVFALEWKAELSAMILRDRNHPSVVLWSIGNEMYERGSAEGARLAKELTARIRELDTTRPVTAGVNGVGKGGEWNRTDPLFSSLDVAGYNYELTRHAEDHARVPQRVIASTESYLSDVWNYRALARDNAYVIGDFVWSAIDYLGEAGIGRVFGPDEKLMPHWEGNHYPWHGAACGDIDLIGQRKPLSHYRAIVWDRGERLSLAVVEPTSDGRPWKASPWAPAPVQSSWTWPGFEGRLLQVEVYSAVNTVRLYLNGTLLGEKTAGAENQCRAVFEVPYTVGSLRAVGVENGRETLHAELVTAGAAAQLSLQADRGEISADGQDLSFVSVQIEDAKGKFQPNGRPPIQYSIEGPGQIAAIGSADLTSTETYQQNPRAAYRGRALVIIRSTQRTGKIKLTATTPGLKSATTTIRAARPSR